MPLSWYTRHNCICFIYSVTNKRYTHYPITGSKLPTLQENYPPELKIGSTFVSDKDGEQHFGTLDILSVFQSKV